jgi:large subunit ribosomal protein L22
MRKLLESAVANAKHNDSKTSEENLFVKEIRIDEGPTLKRSRARARRAAYVIRKRTSRISLALGEREKKKEAKASPAISKTKKLKS